MFFFSSRRRHTRLQGDWSSDVCSSDLGGVGAAGGGDHVARVLLMARRVADDELAAFGGEVAVGHVDGDALLAFGRQAVGQQRQVGLAALRSEEHTSELQSPCNLVCRLLLDKKK